MDRETNENITVWQSKIGEKLVTSYKASQHQKLTRWVLIRSKLHALKVRVQGELYYYWKTITISFGFFENNYIRMEFLT